MSGNVISLDKHSPAKYPTISVNKYLKCILCSKFAVPPILSCDNAHVVCGLCIVKHKEDKEDHQKKCKHYDKYCFCCKRLLAPNPVLDKALEHVEIPCHHKEYGCKTKVKASDMMVHLLICPHIGILCKESSARICHQQSPMGPVALFEHWKEHHKITKLDLLFKSGRDLGAGVSVFQTHLVFFDRSDRGYRISYFEHETRPFFIHIMMHNGLIHIWITCLGSQDFCRQYTVTLGVLSYATGDTVPKISWKTKPLPMWYYDLDKAKATGDMCLFYPSLLKPATQTDRNIQGATVMGKYKDVGKVIMAGQCALWTLKLDLHKDDPRGNSLPNGTFSYIPANCVNQLDISGINFGLSNVNI